MSGCNMCDDDIDVWIMNSGQFHGPDLIVDVPKVLDANDSLLSPLCPPMTRM